MPDLASALDYPPELVRRYLESGLWTDELPHDWLAVWAESRPSRLAVIGPEGSLTFEALYLGARRVAAGLQERGFVRGDVIALQLPNVPEFFLAFFGIQIMGAVPCVLHIPYRAGELEPMLAHGGAKGIFCFAGLAGYDAPPVMLELAATVPALETVIVVGGDAPAGTVGFEELSGSEAAPPPPPAAGDPAVLAFTSGTSASPKAVVHPYRTYVSCARHCMIYCDIGAEDVVLCAPAFTHAFGLVVALTALKAGAANALLPAYSPPALDETLTRARVTKLFCGPAHVAAGMQAGLFGPDATRSLQRVFIGGAVCPPDVVIAMQEACGAGKVHQAWGMTEVLMQIIGPLDAPFETRKTSVGRVFGGHELRVVASDGARLAAGEEGELELRGPFLFQAYFDNPEANRDAFSPDGWFRTGDLATIDDDGDVRVTGRLKDIINRGGIKINPVDIEDLMDRHPAVVQSAVVPMPDAVLGERACLFVVLAPGKTLTLDDVRAYLDAKRVAKVKWPERLEVVEAMPMTPTRKIIKGRLVLPR